jgi:pantoate--beta-alanine ligase
VKALKAVISIETTEELIKKRSELTGSVGFVPTMGALHAGHMSLIRRAREENDRVIVSVFVNPMQFLPGEDYERYPRKLEADRLLCKSAGCDLLFLPPAEAIYGADEPAVRAPKVAGYVLEGHERPGHFDGMLTVVLKLLNLTRPTRAYFGEKDAQQLILIRRMVDRFFLPTEIVAAQTVRQKDGLALSSRNEYLSDTQRSEALKISQSLFEASRLIKQGRTDSAAIEAAMRQVLTPLPIDYVAITDRRLRPIESIVAGESLILVAARVGSVRLIDNMWV